MITKFINNKYASDKPYDDAFPKVINSVKTRTIDNNDDFLLMMVGTTGTGKSNLGLHAIDLYSPDDLSIEYVALNQGDFANSLKKVATKEGKRYVMNDEANISKRDSLTKYNKKVIDLYFSIRGLNIFHIWCNPSLDMIDKEFIEEKINGVIFIIGKDKKRPRLYYYFRKKDILKVYEKMGNLKLRTLKKYAKRFAFYQGWFKEYNGQLKSEYLKKKGDRMIEKIDEFHGLFGKEDETRDESFDNFIPSPKVSKMLGLHRNTIKVYQKQLESEGIIEENINYVLLLNGRTAYDQFTIEKFREIAKNNRKKSELPKKKAVLEVFNEPVSNYTHEGKASP